MVIDSMNKNNQYVVELLNKYFNGGINQKVFFSLLTPRLKQAKLFDYIERMLNAWNLFLNDSKYKIDFEIALRDYMLYAKCTVEIKNYSLSDKSKNIGLYKIADDIIGVNYDYPNYINNKFVKDVSSASKVNLEPDSSYNLYTNKYIHKLTGFDSFKSEEQKLCVMGSLKAPKGSTTLISMPTSGGKSLIIQSLAFQENGLTIVIVPTVSLMIDQVDNARKTLKCNNNEIMCYHSGVSKNNVTNIEKLLMKKEIKLLFLSPETLIKNEKIYKIICDLNESKYLKNFIIDEAHIIFEWGDSFRVDFQCLDVIKNELLMKNPNIRTYLLSATFSQEDVEILKKFYCPNGKWIELRCDSFRREIRYNFIEAKASKLEKLKELILKLPHPMIVYSRTPKNANFLQKTMQKEGLYNTRVYSGETTSFKREEIIQEWKNNKFQIMFATSAFGVGVDKKDVRTVLHIYVPENPSKYYQEAGRSGRDGCAALSVILYSKNESDIFAYEDNEVILNDDSFDSIKSKVLTIDKLSGRWFSMLRSAKRQGNKRILIDTFVKPEYNDSNEYIVEISDKDINWNIYVLLFLKRHSLIKIESVMFKNSKYFMLITYLQDWILNDNNDTKEKLIKLLNYERKSLDKAYNDMKKMLNNANEECVTETFLKSFKLINYIYCAGCNAHSDSREEKHSGLPLISNPEAIIEFNRLKKEKIKIIRTINYDKIENSLIKSNYNLIVTNRKVNVETNDSNFIMFKYEEFKLILDNKLYYLSNGIIIECPSDENLHDVTTILEKLLSFNLRIVILIKEDYLINSKKFSDLFESVVIDEHIVLKGVN